MTSFVEINGKKFQNVGDVARLTGYSRDYIGRLAREEKIIATQVGRQWFVSLPSLEQYVKNIEREQQDRKEKLSDERRREREAVERRQKRERIKAIAERRKRLVSKVTALAVLAVGVGLGVFLNQTTIASLASQKHVARVSQDALVSEEGREYPVATGEIVEPLNTESMDFSREVVNISTLSGESVGVLLLPQGSDKPLTTDEVNKLFSDEVKIIKDADGVAYVVKVGKDGKEERLPFAVVPVTNSETP